MGRAWGPLRKNRADRGIRPSFKPIAGELAQVLLPGFGANVMLLFREFHKTKVVDVKGQPLYDQGMSRNEKALRGHVRPKPHDGGVA